MVAAVEKSLILDMGPAARQKELTQDLTELIVPGDQKRRV
ncbi:hypothetical protein A2U01_0118398, partial [Trifolium medium]|nr:hypothetical protein [Trifolium medium]